MRKTNPDFDLVIDTLHLYYDMKLVTFGIDTERNLIIQFPVFIQPYTQQPLNCTRSHHRSEHTGTLLHTPTDRQAIYCLKFRNKHHN